MQTETKFYEIEMFKVVDGAEVLVCKHYITCSAKAYNTFQNKFGRFMFFKKGSVAFDMQMFTCKPVKLKRKTKPATEFFL